MYDPLIAILYLIVGLILGKALEKTRWIEKFIDIESIKEHFKKNEENEKERSIAE